VAVMLLLAGGSMYFTRSEARTVANR
jgi:hypothetical protein